MSLVYSHAYCEDCQKHTIVYREGVNHILHFLITVLSIGLWAFVWLFLAITRGKWRCQDCGSVINRGTIFFYKLVGTLLFLVAAILGLASALYAILYYNAYGTAGQFCQAGDIACHFRSAVYFLGPISISLALMHLRNVILSKI